MEEASNPADLRRGSFFFGLPVAELALACLGFLALSLLYYENLVTDQRTFASADLTIFFIPFRITWIEQAQQGIFPLWNPFTSSGNPLLAPLQPAVLYPFSWFYLLFPFFWVFNLSIILHMGLAGFFMYWLMRAGGCSRPAALIAALGFMLGGYLFSLHHYLSTLLPVVWTPLLLLCYFGGLLRRDRRLAVAAAGVAALMFLAGGVETCYQIIGWLLVLTLLPVPLLEGASIPPFRERIVHAGLFVVFLFGFIAVQLLPTYELTQWSVRSQGLGAETAAKWSMKPRDILQWFFLDPHGYLTFPRSTFQEQIWLRACYTGLIPFLLGAFFWFTGRIRAGLCLLVMLVSFLLALGKQGFLFLWFFDHLPFFNLFRYPVKWILPFILVLAMSSAWGWDALQRLRKKPGSNWLTWFFIGLATLMMIGLEVIELFEEPLIAWMNENGLGLPDYNLPAINLANLERLLGFTSLFGLCVFLLLRFPNRRSLWAGAAVLVFGLDVFFSVHRFYWTVPAEKILADTATERFLKQEPGVFRVYVTPESEVGSREKRIVRTIRGTRVGGVALPLPFRNWPGIDQLGGWNVIRKITLVNFLKKLNEFPGKDRINLLRMANVKYVVHAAPHRIKDLPEVFVEHPPKEASDPRDPLREEWPMRVYRVPDPFPRAYLVDHCRVAAEESAYQNLLFRPDFDAGSYVVLNESPPELPCSETAAPPDEGRREVHWKERRPDRLRLSVESSRDRFLFLGDSFYPGWKAWVDENEVPVYRANYTFRAIVVPAGAHEVVFAYRPASFRVGAGITALALLLAAGFWLAASRRRVRRGAPEPSGG